MLYLIVTSRHRLQLQGSVVEVPPLPRAEARVLFEARAREAVASFSAPPDAIESLLDTLQGNPLAIELAAAQMDLYTPASAQARLLSGVGWTDCDAGPDRHRSLDRCIAWSWSLLGPEERRALVAASLFAGSFSASDAAAIAGGRPDRVEGILEGMTRKGLVRTDRAYPPAFQLPFHVGWFARGHAGRRDELGHLAWCHGRALALVRDLWKRDLTAEEHRWIGAELGQRAWAAARPDHAAILVLLTTEGIGTPMDEVRPILGQLEAWLEELDDELAFEACLRQVRIFDLGDAEAHDWFGRAARHVGHHPQAASRLALHRAERLARERRYSDMRAVLASARIDAPRSRVLALHLQTQAHLFEGDLAAAAVAIGRALRLSRRAGLVQRTLSLAAYLAQEQGRSSEAASLQEKALMAFEANGAILMAAHARVGLAFFRRNEGRWAESTSLLDEAEEGYALLGDDNRLGLVYVGRANIATYEGQWDRAHAWLDRIAPGEAEPELLNVTRAEIHALQGHREPALSLVREALAVYIPRGWKTAIVHCSVIEMLLEGQADPDRIAALRQRLTPDVSIADAEVDRVLATWGTAAALEVLEAHDREGTSMWTLARLIQRWGSDWGPIEGP